MRDEDIDDMLRRASASGSGPDPALLARVGQKIGSGLAPVRPLQPSWMLAAGLV